MTDDAINILTKKCAEYRIELQEMTERVRLTRGKLIAMESALAALTETKAQPINAPRSGTIKARILEHLCAAGPSGIKASEIREALYREGLTNIHAKTVGMNLYRFFKEGAARREGIHWFYTP